MMEFANRQNYIFSPQEMAFLTFQSTKVCLIIALQKTSNDKFNFATAIRGKNVKVHLKK